MSGSRHPRTFRIALALGVAMALVTCTDEPTLPTGTIQDSDALLQALGPGIHPVLSAPAWHPGGGGEAFLARLQLRAVDVEGEIGSYQGELRYDTKVLEVTQIRVPGDLLAVWNETEPGVIRFAGISLEGLKELPVLILDIRSKSEVTAESFEVVLEEVVSSKGFRDLTSRVGGRRNPVLVR